MNKVLEYNVTGQNIELASAAMLVAGTVNEYTARFSFGADWDGYQRVAVFNADGMEREQMLKDDTCKVPWEVLKPGAYLKVGVYGTKDGNRLPTIWTSHRQYIHDGAGPTDEAADPSPVLAEQILQRMGNLGDLKTEDKSSLVSAINEVQETGGGGTADHAKLKNRDAADQHPMGAITGLEDALDGKQEAGNYLTKESDPTVPEWAKQPQKPAYTAQEVGALPDTTHIPSTADDVNAEPLGAVAQHNSATDAHSDIRLLIQGLTDRLNALADSDDTTLDQLSEVVAYIKSNRDLISAITTDKVSVADIVDNLTTNVSNKPLSAAQGVALKALIDAITVPTALSELSEDATHRVVTDAEKAAWNAKSNFSGSYNDLTDKPTIPEAYTLPIASPTVLGGVQPVAKTDEMTQSVGVDEAGALWTAEASGGGSGGGFQKVLDFTTEEAVTEFSTPGLTQEQADAIASASILNIVLYIPRDTADEATDTTGTVNIFINTGWDDYILQKFTAIPKPTETWTKYGSWTFTVFKHPKSISYTVDNNNCSFIVKSGRFNSSNWITPALTGSSDSYRRASVNNYFKVSGSQTMAAGTRFIVEVVAT